MQIFRGGGGEITANTNTGYNYKATEFLCVCLCRGSSISFITSSWKRRLSEPQWRHVTFLDGLTRKGFVTEGNIILAYTSSRDRESGWRTGLFCTSLHVHITQYFSSVTVYRYLCHSLHGHFHAHFPGQQCCYCCSLRHRNWRHAQVWLSNPVSCTNIDDWTKICLINSKSHFTTSLSGIVVFA